MFSNRLPVIACLSMILILPGCVGAAIGAGATLGVAAAKEGGISGAASDLEIKALINDKWFKYDVDTFRKLNLTVDQGRVLLTGVVQNPDSRVEAVKLVWQVGGVKQVINEIRVAESDGFPGYVRDEWITTRLRTALTFDRDVQSINYSIDTVQGTVYLMGVAVNQAELDRAIEIARTIPNVQQVVSYVKLAGEVVHDQVAAPPQQGSVQTIQSTTIQTTAPAPQPMLTAPSYQNAPPNYPPSNPPMQNAPLGTSRDRIDAEPLR